MAVIARHLMVKGRVQGVWFRAWMVEVAGGLGLFGWVRNRANGDVEALVEGETEAVERFLEMAWTGPPAARVSHVEISDHPIENHVCFEQRATL